MKPIGEEARARPRPAADETALADDAARGFDERVPKLSTISPRTPSRLDSARRRALALADVTALCVSYGGVWLLAPPSAPLQSKLILAATLPIWVVLNKLLGLYDRDANVLHKSTLDELPRIVQSVVLGSALVFLLVPLLPGVSVGRVQTLCFIGLALVLVPGARALSRTAVNRRAVPERCLIVGSGLVAQDLANKLASHPEYGAQIVGFIDAEGESDISQPHEQPVATSTARFEQVCERLAVDRVVIAFGTHSNEDLLGIIAIAKQLNVKVTVVPRLFETIGGAVEIDQLEGVTLLGLRGLGRTKSSLRIKRTLDIALAAPVLIALSPLLALIALAIKLSSRGPVLYRQHRIGRDDRAFDILKFRTMHVGADELKPSLAHLNEVTAPMFKIRDDPRITPLGRVLRRHSLDELPQLWNVLRGEMSLVGPRPLVPAESKHVIGRHRSRLLLTPGVTGPWQVSGRSAVPFAEMVRLDYLYVAEWSLWNDIKLLLRTAVVVARGTGH